MEGRSFEKGAYLKIFIERGRSFERGPLFGGGAHSIKTGIIALMITIVSKPSKCLKFMTFRRDVLSYLTECKYLSETLKTFYHH